MDIKKLLLATAVLALAACNQGTATESDSLSSNTSWPYAATGTVDIIDAAFTDSDYASWAIGTITVGDEDYLIQFDASVLQAANIDANFNFSSPTTLMLGAPNEETGVLAYPVENIQ